MESMQHQLQEVEKRRNDPMLEHQKVQREVTKDTKHPRQEKTVQKESLAAREVMWKIREGIEWKEERLTLLSDKVDKNTTAAEMEAELQGLQAGEKRGSNAPQAVECCLETMMEQIFAMGTDQARSELDALYQKILKRLPLPLLCKRQECQEEKKDEETEKARARQSQSVVGVTHASRGQSSCTSEQFGA